MTYPIIFIEPKYFVTRIGPYLVWYGQFDTVCFPIREYGDQFTFWYSIRDPALFFGKELDTTGYISDFPGAKKPDSEFAGMTISQIKPALLYLLSL